MFALQAGSLTDFKVHPAVLPLGALSVDQALVTHQVPLGQDGSGQGRAGQGRVGQGREGQGGVGTGWNRTRVCALPLCVLMLWAGGRVGGQATDDDGMMRAGLGGQAAAAVEA